MLETVSLYFSQVTHPCVHLLYTYFCLSFARSTLFIYAGLMKFFCLAFLLTGMNYILGGRDPWIPTLFLGPLFPPGPYPIRLCQADTCRGQSLFSSGPGLWSCFLPCFLLSSQDAEPHHLMVTAIKAASNFPITLFISKVQQSASFTNDVCTNPIEKGRCAVSCLKETVKFERSPPSKSTINSSEPFIPILL